MKFSYLVFAIFLLRFALAAPVSNAHADASHAAAHASPAPASPAALHAPAAHVDASHVPASPAAHVDASHAPASPVGPHAPASPPPAHLATEHHAPADPAAGPHTPTYPADPHAPASPAASPHVIAPPAPAHLAGAPAAPAAGPHAPTHPADPHAPASPAAGPHAPASPAHPAADPHAPASSEAGPSDKTFYRGTSKKNKKVNGAITDKDFNIKADGVTVTKDDTKGLSLNKDPTKVGGKNNKFIYSITNNKLHDTDFKAVEDGHENHPGGPGHVSLTYQGDDIHKNDLKNKIDGLDWTTKERET